MENKEALSILDACYERVCDGVPLISKPVAEFSREYLQHYHTPEQSAHRMIDAQVLKCGTSGFITGFGGVVTLPVALPANITSVLYVQMRMIASTAYMGGFNPNDDEVQAMSDWVAVVDDDIFFADGRGSPHLHPVCRLHFELLHF